MAGDATQDKYLDFLLQAGCSGTGQLKVSVHPGDGSVLSLTVGCDVADVSIATGGRGERQPSRLGS
jgi:hypothetical protein